jgi:acyl-coenzyme A synthetase/AMP-(fatty) acid ligase
VLEQHPNHWQLNWACAGQAIALPREQQPYSYARWYQNVQLCYQHILQQDGDNVLLYQPDSLQFSIWFIALAMAGKHIVLAADGQPETLALVASHCHWQAQQTFNRDENDAAVELQLKLSSQCRVSFFTSGSSGEPKLISKSLAQLLREVQTLQQQFGSQMDKAELVAGTVSTQHIYGLLFRLLWPLCSNKPFYCEQLSYLEQWQALLSLQRVIFIASPAHLARFDDIAKLAPQADQLGAIFTSGGPLADEVPARYLTTVGQAPIEVFGSTETGGIGFRQRQQNNHQWQAFTGVQLAQDARGALTLQSPHLPDQLPYQTEDQVELLANNSFLLQGRFDRIVKLEEKRLSLPELEQFCQQSELVSAVAALVLQQPKAQLALAVVLSDAGQAELKNHGKLALNQLLKQYLLRRFERVLLPKRFRYLTALPYNAQGKLPRKQLEALFRHD